MNPTERARERLREATEGAPAPVVNVPAELASERPGPATTPPNERR